MAGPFIVDLADAPAWEHHVFVGAGDGPCWILQVGARREGSTLDSPWPEPKRVRPPWPPS